MPRVRPIINSFNAGELTPLLDGRVDQDKYFSGAKTLINWIPTVQGPARRRGGTRHAGLVKDSNTRTWLAEYSFSVSQAYVLEFGNNYLRFWVNRGLLLNGGVPYEVVTPYAAADLATAEGTFALRLVSSGDVTWITHVEGKYQPQRLSRLGATSWTLLPDPLASGPFRDTNTDKGFLLQASGFTGTGLTVTSVSGQPIFLVPGFSFVGSLLLLESENPAATVPPYQPSQSYTSGNQVRNAGNVYETPGGGPVVTSVQRYPPTHTEGTAFDGIYQWTYLHSGYGWGLITAVAPDGLSATVDTIARFPNDVASASTHRWAFGDFSPVYGWPTTVGFFKERLTYTRGRTAYLSVVGDFLNFNRRDAGLITKETAVQLTLASDKFETIRWQSTFKSLLLGSARAETALQEQTSQTVFAADNAQNTPQTDYGGRLIRPLRVGSSVLFVERAGHRVREMQYSFETDSFKAEDLTVLSEHIFDGSEVAGDVEGVPREIIDWAYQQQRDSLVWCVLSDGTLACLVLNRERGVVGWTPHYLGGDAFVESVQSIPSPDGRLDDVWFIVRRTVNGQVQRSVEFLLDYRLVKNGVGEAVHVDNSVTYRGAATSVVTGLGHLEGETVAICVDGSNHPPVVVTGGQATLQRPGSLIHVGYNFVSRYQSMRLEVQGGGGTTQTTRKGIAEVFLRVQSTTGGKFGGSFDKLDTIPTLQPGATLGTPPALFSGDIELRWPGGWNTDGYICYEQDLPLPATLVAIVTRVQIND